MVDCMLLKFECMYIFIVDIIWLYIKNEKEVFLVYDISEKYEYRK